MTPPVRSAAVSRLLPAAAGLLALLWVVLPASATTPDPLVTGPVPAVGAGDPSHNYPWFATNVDLAAAGYVEEEYFIEGTANRYNTPAQTTATVIDGGHGYRTRIVVRRPADARKFNGTVLLEWYNVTAGYDLEVQWFLSHEHITRAGYAWVGVSAQRVGVQGGGPGSLRVWSPERYGTLDVTNGGTINNDALSYDIFSQAAQAVRSPAGVAPLADLDVQRVMAVGASQSASRLVVYYNSVQPLAEVVDGFLIFVGGGTLRSDLAAPAFKILSETDVRGQLARQQPDTATYRNWQVAGTSHFDAKQGAGVTPLLVRDEVPAASSECVLPPGSQIPMHNVVNAAYEHLVRWVDAGVPPPSAPPVEVGPPPLFSIVRDELGNALGGIRLSEHAVPTGTNTGENSGALFCFLFGSSVPFDAGTLSSLYRNHGSYVSRVSHVSRDNVADGYLLQEDAAITKRTAAQSGVGKKN